jgi:hypothetical protein
LGGLGGSYTSVRPELRVIRGVVPTCLRAVQPIRGWFLERGKEEGCRYVPRSMVALWCGLENGCLSLSPLCKVEFWCRKERGHPGQSIQIDKSGALFGRALSAFHVSDPITAAYCTCNRVLALIDFWSGDPQGPKGGQPPFLSINTTTCVERITVALYYCDLFVHLPQPETLFYLNCGQSIFCALHSQFSLITDRIVAPPALSRPVRLQTPLPRTLSTHLTF